MSFPGRGLSGISGHNVPVDDNDVVGWLSLPWRCVLLLMKPEALSAVTRRSRFVRVQRYIAAKVRLAFWVVSQQPREILLPWLADDVTDFQDFEESRKRSV